jgi:signal transduction histidine kinase
VRVPETGGDELARLARTFNQMSSSIQEARRELIRQERLTTIGRLATSIVHDLRNPLAAIYGGAEMMVDGELNPRRRERVAQTIYRSSRVIKELLQELVDVSRGRPRALLVVRHSRCGPRRPDALRRTAQRAHEVPHRPGHRSTARARTH